MGYLLLNTPRSDPRFAEYLAGYREVADFRFPTRAASSKAPNADHPQLSPKFSSTDGAFEFGSFSAIPRVDGPRIRFSRGDVPELYVEGLQSCTVETPAATGLYRAPHGVMNTRVSYTSGSLTRDKPFTINWTLKYR